MTLSNQHKALILTVLISGTLVLTVFNFHLKQHRNLSVENYYDIEHIDPLLEAELNEMKNENNDKAETNKAFNDTEKEHRFKAAYTQIEPPKDYIKPEFNEVTETHHINSNTIKNSSAKEIKKEDLEAFNKVNDLLKEQEQKSFNTKSTIHYSLVNRTHNYLPIPIYLCEEGGQIVINITVNSNGHVIEAYLNTSSTSKNECLIDKALEYANEARFNSDLTKAEQIGSITFNFEGKR